MALPSDPTTARRIFAVAREVFLQKGCSGARMQDIADRAGINKALLHYYFSSKEKLFEAVFREAIKAFIPRIGSIISDPGTSLFFKIEKFCAEYIFAMMADPFIPLFVINEINKQPEQFLKKVWGDKKPPVNLLLGQIREDIRLGRIRAVEPHHLLMNILSLCIFPFLGKPLWQFIAGHDDAAFQALLEQRKREVPRFVSQAIRT